MNKLNIGEFGKGLEYLASGSLVAAALLLTTSAVASSHQAVIEQRQHGFEAIDEQAEQIERELKADKIDWLRVQELAENNQGLSENLLGQFPQGSAEDSRAKDKIWTERTEFDGLLKQMEQGFGELYQAAGAGQFSAAKQGLKQAKDTCRACHRKYRSFW